MKQVKPLNINLSFYKFISYHIIFNFQGWEENLKMLKEKIPCAVCWKGVDSNLLPVLQMLGRCKGDVVVLEADWNRIMSLNKGLAQVKKQIQPRLFFNLRKSIIAHVQIYN